MAAVDVATTEGEVSEDDEDEGNDSILPAGEDDEDADVFSEREPDDLARLRRGKRIKGGRPGG